MAIKSSIFIMVDHAVPFVPIFLLGPTFLPCCVDGSANCLFLDAVQGLSLSVQDDILETFTRIMTLFFALSLCPSETRPNAPAGAVAMLSQIMCPGVPVKPDFNAEEKASIEKDTREMRQIIAEMAECMPKEDPDKGMCQQSRHGKWGWLRLGSNP